MSANRESSDAYGPTRGRALAGAQSRVRDAREALQRHWTGEENGIFKVMAARDDEYADHVAPLERERRGLDLLLGPGPGKLGTLCSPRGGLRTLLGNRSGA